MQLIPTGDKSYAPPEFGIESNILKTITIPLDDARDLKEFEIGGTCLWAQNASDLAASIDVRINDQSRDALTISQGFFIRGVPFSRIYVTNAAQAGKWIKLLYTVEDVPVQIVNPSSQFDAIEITASIDLIVKVKGADYFKSLEDVSLAAAATTIIIQTNLTNRATILRNLPGNTQTFRIGENLASATRGIPLEPGDSITIESTAGIYGYNPGPLAESIAICRTGDN